MRVRTGEVVQLLHLHAGELGNYTAQSTLTPSMWSLLYSLVFESLREHLSEQSKSYLESVVSKSEFSYAALRKLTSPAFRTSVVRTEAMLALQSLVDRAFRISYLFAAVILVLYLFRWNSRRQRLRRLGSKAPTVRTRAPLGTVAKLPASHVQNLRQLHLAGIDLLATAISKLFNNDFFAWSRQILDNPGRTVSLNMLGVIVLVTDEPENTKAVLSTKVSSSDFSIEQAN